MSPSKKTTKKTARKKKAAATTKSSASKVKKKTKKAAAKEPKKASAKKATKTTAPKKKAAAPTEGKPAARKAAPKKTTRKTASPGGETPKKAAAKPASIPKKQKTQADTEVVADATEVIEKTPSKKKGKAAKKVRPKKLITPTGPRHPKLGYKWGCYACGVKFYDLGKEEPICPKCGADQRDRPPDEPRHTPDVPKPKVVRPMAQLLDEEEPATASADDLDGIDDHAGGAGEMFDESETDDVGLDIEDTELDNSIEPPELDQL